MIVRHGAKSVPFEAAAPTEIIVELPDSLAEDPRRRLTPSYGARDSRGGAALISSAYTAKPRASPMNHAKP